MIIGLLAELAIYCSIVEWKGDCYERERIVSGEI